MWAGYRTMGLCGWSGNSLFALQILQISTMLGACLTALAKLRMHIDSTLVHLEAVTREFSHLVR